MLIWEDGGTPNHSQLLPSRAQGNHIKTQTLHFLAQINCN